MRILPSLLIAAVSPLLANSAVAQNPVIADTDMYEAHSVSPDTAMNGRASWLSFGANSVARSRAGGAWVGTKFYLIGGEITGGARGSTVEALNGPTGVWTTVSTAMPTPVSNIFGSTVAIGNKIYVFGGYDVAAARTAAVQIFDTSSSSWSVHPTPMPVAVYGCLAVHIGGNKVLVTGGSPAIGGGLTDTYTFDVGTGVVTPLAGAPTARYLLSGGYNSAHGKVYSVGGFGTGTVVEAYDLSAGTWATLPPMPNDRAGCGVITIGNYLVAYMGNWTVYRSDGDLYNIATGSWSAGAIPAGPVAKRSFAYAPKFALPLILAAGINGWAGAYLSDNAVLKK